LFALEGKPSGAGKPVEHTSSTHSLTAGANLIDPRGWNIFLPLLKCFTTLPCSALFCKLHLVRDSRSSSQVTSQTYHCDRLDTTNRRAPPQAVAPVENGVLLLKIS